MSVRSPYSCVLWDVDGTLVDAGDGILDRLTRALTHFGHRPPTRDDLVHWIGPPLYDSFRAQLRLDPHSAAEIVRHYRDLARDDGYAAGARLYPGVAALVRDVAAAGIPQATASSKPEVQVAALMDHFDLAPHLHGTTGASDDDSRATKSAVIAEALRRLEAQGVDTSRPVLIGDRHHDVAGAADHGIPVLFVRWGFSHDDESAGAAAVVDDVDGLRALLLPDHRHDDNPDAGDSTGIRPATLTAGPAR